MLVMVSPDILSRNIQAMQVVKDLDSGKVVVVNAFGRQSRIIILAQRFFIHQYHGIFILYVSIQRVHC